RRLETPLLVPTTDTTRIPPVASSRRHTMSAAITNAGRVAVAGPRLQPSTVRAAFRLNTQRLAATQPRPHTAPRLFSTSVLLRSKQDHHQAQPAQGRQTEGGNPELPSFSLNGLGASKG